MLSIQRCMPPIIIVFNVSFGFKVPNVRFVYTMLVNLKMIAVF
jgi:hypothetical protein